MVCMLRERERERGRGGRRGREGTETVRGGDGDGEIRTERDRDAAGRNEKAGKKKKKERNNKRVGKMEKVFNRCVVLPADSSLFCFITSALCSAGCTVSVAEVVWRHCGLAEAWK